jgi:DNA-binding transcriptional ArsR family regulator
MLPRKHVGSASRTLSVSSVKSSNAASKARSLKALAGSLDATFFKAIAEPVRQQIVLILLQQGRSNIQDVAGHLVQDRSVVSRHLAFLEQAGMVRSSKVQRFTEYELDGPAIIEKLERLLDQLRATAAICCPPAEDACCAAPPRVRIFAASVDKPRGRRQ